MSLKYTNTQKTAASFNGASFPLAAPEDFTSIGDGPTRDAVLKWIAKGNTPLPADIPPAPTYRELRAAAYPPVGDQLDAMWEGGAASAAMLLLVNAVKTRFPKEI